MQVIDGVYLTQCGYVVKLNKRHGHSPGKSRLGYPSTNFSNGFGWNQDGTISGMGEGWSDKLKLVEKLDFELPTNLPSGYEFAEGMEFRRPKDGEYFLNVHTSGEWMGSAGLCHRGHTDTNVYNGRRFILKKKGSNCTVKIGDGEPFEAKMSPPTVATYDPHPIHPAPLPISYPDFKPWNLCKEAPTNVNERKTMTVKSALWSVTKFTGSLVKRSAFYWIGEPIMLTLAWVMRCVRYVLLALMLCGGAYTYYKPQEAVSFFKSLLPSVSISFEKPEIFNG